MSEPQSPEMRLAKRVRHYMIIRTLQTLQNAAFATEENDERELADIIARETGLSELLEAAEEVALVGLSIETTERLEAAMAKTKGENHG